MRAQAIDVMDWFIPHKETCYMVLKNTCSFKMIACLFMLVCNQIGHLLFLKMVDHTRFDNALLN
ncbi:hypothetical protein Hanom_Chr03g00192841 [Helianthus anomalus]